MLVQEFEHRMTNGLQLIAGLLSLQSRAMPTPEACIQLGIAARRVVALGTVHHLSDLLFQNRTEHVIVVEGTKVEISSSLANALDHK
jgi:two-component sensor histidine kinase